MIFWKKYDPENIPEADKDYLVTNGRQVESAWVTEWGEGQRFFGFAYMSSVDDYDITHYAEINLPESE